MKVTVQGLPIDIAQEAIKEWAEGITSVVLIDGIPAGVQIERGHEKVFIESGPLAMVIADRVRERRWSECEHF